MSSSNPLIRTTNPFQRRLVDQIERSKPGRGVGVFTRPLPGGMSQTVQRARKAAAAAGSAKPFEVRHVSGDNFSVQGGTCEGQMIATQTVDVGSTRPVAILAYPQYTLSIDSGEYVNAATVKDGANAPVLVSSTSVFGDVLFVSSAGTEARALIAYIDADNVITQFTTGNIIGTFQDDGYLDGKMSGSFNKNA